MSNNQICCIKCRWFEPRSGFCRRNPPIPVVIPDENSSHMMSAFPKIPAPTLDWCAEFQSVNTATVING